MKKITVLTISFLILFAFTVSAYATKPLILRLAHPMAPGNSVSLGYEKFRELVEKKSERKIRVRIFGNTQLGSDRVTTEAVKAGTLEMSSSASPYMASFSKAYLALDLPYITSPEHQEKLYKALDEGELGKELEKASEELGLKTIMFSEYGYRNFVSIDKPLEKVEDLQNLKIRTTDSPVEIAAVKELGMKPIPISWGETEAALRQRIFNAQANTFSLLNDVRHTKFIKYAMDSNHNYSMDILHMNKEKWDSLTAEQQKIIKEAAAEAVAWQRVIAVELEKEAWEAFRDEGIQITKLTKEQREQLKTLTAPVRKHFSKDIPPHLLELIAETQK